MQAAGDVVSEVERAVEQYSRGLGHLCQKLPLPGETETRMILSFTKQGYRRLGSGLLGQDYLLTPKLCHSPVP